MVTSFADGTKISFEQAIVANATGMTVAQRGMRGRGPRRPRRRADHARTTSTSCERARRRRRLRGRQPSPVRASSCWPPTTTRSSGTTSSCTSSARARSTASTRLPPVPLRGAADGGAGGAVRRRRPSRRSGAPTVEVVTTAKRDLPAGTVLDGLGGYDTYGVAERADVTGDRGAAADGRGRGLHADARRRQGRGAHATPTSTLPAGRLVDELRAAQAAELPVRQLAGV